MDTEKLIATLTESGAELGLNLVAAIAIFFIGRWVAKMLRKIAVKAMERIEVDSILVKFFSNMLYIVLLVFVILAAIAQLGVQTTSLIALVGAAGLAVGLALQGSLANFAAGILIIIFRPYRIGDFIEGAGAMGTVEEVQIFTTVLKTPDNRRVIIPNGQVMGGTIVNYTTHPIRRVDLVASVGYGEDSDKVRRVLTELLVSDERTLTDPAPTVEMNAHGDSSIQWIVRPWVKTEDYWSVYWDLTARIKQRLDEEDISIPFPQRDVHLYRHDDAGDD